MNQSEAIRRHGDAMEALRLSHPEAHRALADLFDGIADGFEGDAFAYVCRCDANVDGTQYANLYRTAFRAATYAGAR